MTQYILFGMNAVLVIAMALFAFLMSKHFNDDKETEIRVRQLEKDLSKLNLDIVSKYLPEFKNDFMPTINNILAEIKDLREQLFKEVTKIHDDVIKMQRN